MTVLSRGKDNDVARPVASDCSADTTTQILFAPKIEPKSHTVTEPGIGDKRTDPAS